MKQLVEFYYVLFLGSSKLCFAQCRERPSENLWIAVVATNQVNYRRSMILIDDIADLDWLRLALAHEFHEIAVAN